MGLADLGFRDLVPMVSVLAFSGIGRVGPFRRSSQLFDDWAMSRTQKWWNRITIFLVITAIAAGGVAYIAHRNGWGEPSTTLCVMSPDGGCTDPRLPPERVLGEEEVYRSDAGDVVAVRVEQVEGASGVPEDVLRLRVLVRVESGSWRFAAADVRYRHADGSEHRGEVVSGPDLVGVGSPSEPWVLDFDSPAGAGDEVGSERIVFVLPSGKEVVRWRWPDR